MPRTFEANVIKPIDVTVDLNSFQTEYSPKTIGNKLGKHFIYSHIICMGKNGFIMPKFVLG